MVLPMLVDRPSNNPILIYNRPLAWLCKNIKIPAADIVLKAFSNSILQFCK